LELSEDDEADFRDFGGDLGGEVFAMLVIEWRGRDFLTGAVICSLAVKQTYWLDHCQMS
jgi:hypothetical protein